MKDKDAQQHRSNGTDTRQIYENRGKISQFTREIIPRLCHEGFYVLFVRYHQALRYPIACLDEIDTILVLSGRDDHL